MNDGFSIRIFAPAGYDQGLQIVEKDNWIGKAVTCRRSTFLDAQKRPEFQRPGVYIVYGLNDTDGSEKVYIGEGDPALPRLQSHYKTKDFWTDLICFTAAEDSLTKSHIQYLESRLVQLAHRAKRVELENGNIPSASTLSEAEVAYAERFLENMLGCLALLRITFFLESSGKKDAPLQEFVLKVRGANAFGYETAEGFVVNAGSSGPKTVTNAFTKPSAAFRQRLLGNGVLIEDGENIRFAQDYLFDSPSAAASIIGGNPYNGRIEWKTNDGSTLKSIQEARLVAKP
jgi:Domain of unknown function (DUF4357)